MCTYERLRMVPVCVAGDGPLEVEAHEPEVVAEGSAKRAFARLEGGVHDVLVEGADLGLERRIGAQPLEP
jgi:hypothetical protein